MVDTKTAMRPLVLEESGPIPSSKALAPVALLRRIETVPASAANEFAADWELEDFLREAGIEILDYEAVCRKMLRLADAKQARWGWYRLRQQDRGDFAGWTHSRLGTAPRLGKYEPRSALTHGRLVNEVYPLAVPQLAWELIFWLERGFGGHINCFVTHYEARQPDPFLAVTVNGRELFVIAEWDRPGRRSPLRRLSWWRWL